MRSGSHSRFHFSGRTTSRAPRSAASRTSRSAVARLRSASSVEFSWMAAARVTMLSPSSGLTGQSTAPGEEYRPPCMENPYAVSRRRHRAPGRRRRAAGADAAVPGRPDAQALALRRPLRPRDHAVRRLGTRRADVAGVVGGVGPAGAPPGRAHAAGRGACRVDGRACGAPARGRRGRVDRPRARRGPGRRDGDSGGAHVHLDAQAGRRPGSRARARGRPRVGGRRPGLRGRVSAGYHARITSWRWSAGRGHRSRRAFAGVELRRRHPRLAARQRAHRLGRRRAVGAGAGALRRRSLGRRAGRRRRAALRRRGDRAGATTTCSSCAAATSSRSGRSRASSPAASSWPRATG